MNPSQPYPNSAFPNQNHPSKTITTTTILSTNVVVVQPYFDPLYLKTIPGILKLVQLVLMLVAFILAAAAWSSNSWFDSYAVGSAGWVKFVTMTAFISTLFFLILYLFHLIERIYQVNWLLTEMIHYIFWAVLLLTAGAVMIPPRYDGTRGAVVFFCWAGMIAYGVDAFFKFKSYRNGEAAQGIRPTSSVVTTTIPA